MKDFIKSPTLIGIESDKMGKYLFPNGSIYFKKLKPEHLNPLDSKEEFIFKRYVASAKKRNKPFFLTKHFFKALINSPCAYCFSNKSLSGIDRIENEQGYTYDNCLPCCKICNRAKHTLKYFEFDEWMENIAKKYKNHYNFNVELDLFTVFKEASRKEIKNILQQMRQKFVILKRDAVNYRGYRITKEMYNDYISNTSAEW